MADQARVTMLANEADAFRTRWVRVVVAGQCRGVQSIAIFPDLTEKRTAGWRNRFRTSAPG